MDTSNSSAGPRMLCIGPGTFHFKTPHSCCAFVYDALFLFVSLFLLLLLLSLSYETCRYALLFRFNVVQANSALSLGTKTFVL
jgi:hypothetical protein